MTTTVIFLRSSENDATARILEDREISDLIMATYNSCKISFVINSAVHGFLLVLHACVFQPTAARIIFLILLLDAHE